MGGQGDKGMSLEEFRNQIMHKLFGDESKDEMEDQANGGGEVIVVNGNNRGAGDEAYQNHNYHRHLPAPAASKHAYKSNSCRRGHRLILPTEDECHYGNILQGKDMVPGKNTGYESDANVERESKQCPVGPPLHLVVPHIPPPGQPDRMNVIKVSNIVGIDPKPFNPETYVEEDAFITGESEGKKRIHLNVVRWRMAKNADGTESPESNARVVKWKDGSMQLLIGDEALDNEAPGFKYNPHGRVAHAGFEHDLELEALAERRMFNAKVHEYSDSEMEELEYETELEDIESSPTYGRENELDEKNVYDQDLEEDLGFTSMSDEEFEIMKSRSWRCRGGALGARARGEAAAAAAPGLFAWRRDGGVPGSLRGEDAASPAGRQCRRHGEELHGYNAPPVGIVGAAVLKGRSLGPPGRERRLSGKRRRDYCSGGRRWGVVAAAGGDGCGGLQRRWRSRGFWMERFPR
ncbi:hypothetical protein ACQ4PT_062374 [Festuca glaucescens]